jgi:hypothetical protein
VRNLSHPDLGAKLLELDPPKRLGQEVGELVLDVDVVGPDTPFIQAASDEVIPHPDVLAALMEDRVLCQGQGGLAICNRTNQIIRAQVQKQAP